MATEHQHWPGEEYEHHDPGHEPHEEHEAWNDDVDFHDVDEILEDEEEVADA